MTDHYQIQKRDRNLEDKLAALDQQACSGAVMKHKETFLSRLFPNELQREAARHRTRLIQTEFRFREETFEILRSTQIQAIKEMCKDHLIKCDTPRKRELAEFVMEEKSRLEDKLMNLTEDFHARITRAYESAEKLPIPELKNRAMDRIYETIDSYHTMSSQLQQRFQRIIDDAARRYDI